MSLKDVMRDDLRKGRVWFDPGGMGGWHVVNGQKVLCVLDAACLAEAAPGRRGEGVQTGSLSLYLRADEYRGLPHVGQSLTVDGRTYRIAACADAEGVLELQLTEARAL